MKANALSLRSKTTVGIALLTLMLVLFSLVAAAWVLRQDSNARRAEIEPRMARLLGVQQQKEQLIQANEKAATQLNGLVYPSTEDATLAGTKMQQDVRKAIENAGMSIVGSRVRPVKIAEGYDEISLDLTVEGSMPALEQTLLAIPKLRPLVVIEETNIKPKQGRNVPHVMTVRFRLTAARIQS